MCSFASPQASWLGENVAASGLKLSRLRQDQRISRNKKRPIRLRRFGRAAQLWTRADGGGNLHEFFWVIILYIFGDILIEFDYVG